MYTEGYDYEPVLGKDEVVLFFNGEFNDGNIHNLIHKMEVADLDTNCENIVLYFTSEGGSFSSYCRLKDYINNQLRSKLKIIVSEIAGSSGFWLLLELNTEKVTIDFLEDSYGVIHLPTIDLDARELLKRCKTHKSFSSLFKSSLEKLNKRLTDNYINKMSITEEERKEILEGGNVFLCMEDLKRVVDDFRKKENN